MTDSGCDSLPLDVPVDVNVRVRAQHTAGFVALDQTEIRQHLDIFVDPLDVPSDTPGQL